MIIIEDDDKVLDNKQRKVLIQLANILGTSEEFKGTLVHFPNIRATHSASWCRKINGDWAWLVEN